MHTSVVVIGAGQAGLAMSHHLTTAGVDHVVLERGEVARSWRTERWDSLRLLTPNWMSALPGWRYAGADPDGFMRASEVVDFLDGYRRSIDAPVLTDTAVQAVRRTPDGFGVATDRDGWQCDAVVVATGASSEPRVPALAPDLPSRIDQLTALEYRRPEQLRSDGRVLVVGASASGVQIADELATSGRDVTVAVGEHIRMPRQYRGRDIYAWMDAIGQLDERYDEVDDVERARRHASLQLVGSPDRRTLDLNALDQRGIALVGRLMRVVGSTAQCSGSLASLVANADLKQDRMLDRVDEFVETAGLADEVEAPDRPGPTRLGDVPTEIDLSEVSTVIWATGYRPAYRWLDPGALDRRGRIAHDGGVGSLAGLFVLGLPFLRRRRSVLIAGAGDDAADLMGPLRSHLDAMAHTRVHRGARV